MSSGRVERDFAVHTFPVAGIEWAGLHSVLSHAHQACSSNSGAGAMVRNELCVTDVRTGRTTPLRTAKQGQSGTGEEPPISMLRVSHLKQYFIVAFAFRHAPFELWDLKSLTLLRVMPKKFPPITALDWSPLHNLKSLKRRLKEADKGSETSGGLSPENDEKENAKPGPDKKSTTDLVAKEHFVFTDPDGQLYHFSVEGNTIKDGTKVPAEASLATITCIAWKSDLIVRGDSEGNLNVWDVRTRTARSVATNRGAVKKVRFAPGRGNLKILVMNSSGDAVSVWDVKSDLELYAEARFAGGKGNSNGLPAKVLDIDWAASDRAVLACADGTLRVVGLALTPATSAMSEYGLLDCSSGSDEEESLVPACHHLVPNKARNNFHHMLHHQPWMKGGISFDISTSDGLSHSEADFLRRQVELLPPGAREFMESAKTPPVERLLMASQLAGLTYEADFWRLVRKVLNRKESSSPLDPRFDLLLDAESYKKMEREKMLLRESRAGVNRDTVI